MPLFYQQHINQHTQIAIWKIEETEDFFLEKVTTYNNISNATKRLQHLAARYLLNFLHNDFCINDIAITETGKPYLPNEQYQFSISHCNNYAAVIVSSQQQVAIDIEINNNKVLKIIDKFLSKQELTLMNNIIATQEFETLPTILWSAKESMFKWYAKGNVSFQNMLQLHIHKINNSVLPASFWLAQKEIPLNIYFKILNGICLTYIVE